MKIASNKWLHKYSFKIFYKERQCLKSKLYFSTKPLFAAWLTRTLCCGSVHFCLTDLENYLVELRTKNILSVLSVRHYGDTPVQSYTVEHVIFALNLRAVWTPEGNPDEKTERYGMWNDRLLVPFIAITLLGHLHEGSGLQRME